MEILENNVGMTLTLVLLVGAMVLAAGLQIWLCIRCKSLLVRLIPVLVCLGLVLVSILSLNGQVYSVILTACSIMLLLFTGVGWAVARILLKNQR